MGEKGWSDRGGCRVRWREMCRCVREQLQEKKKKKTPANAHWRLPSVSRGVWFLQLDSPAEAMALK